VDYVGYSYWRNINNHVGSDTMLIFLGLNRSQGGSGPTLFSYNKVTGAVQKIGPLFDAASSFNGYTGEGWYFSGTQPTKLYVNEGPNLWRYDVLSKQLEHVFDVGPQFGADKYIWQLHSSTDDRVHSATLRHTATYEMLGCMAYREDTRQFFYYPKRGDFDECQVDSSGRWLLIKENVDGSAGEDNRIIDLQSGVETVLLDQNGAAGHSDNGHGYMVAADNWNNLPGAVRMWKFGQTPLQGSLVYHTTDWAVDVGHFSHTNAKPGVAPEAQYGCSSNASQADLPRANEIVCFRLDTSLDVLVVAPVMTDLSASGGGDEYSKMPKGNLDVTGQYFIWTSNTGGNRLDAFIVKVPGQLLTGGSSDTTTSPSSSTTSDSTAPSAADTTAPSVAILAPTDGSSVGSRLEITVQATDSGGLSDITVFGDGAPIGGIECAGTSCSGSVTWRTRRLSRGAHSITAVATDAAGNSRSSPAITVYK
jgi:hypothetical protein